MIRVRDGMHVVGWDSGFKFGVAPSDDDIQVENAVLASAVGAAFLSGSPRVLVFHVTNDGSVQSLLVGGHGVMLYNTTLSQVSPGELAVLCGPGVEFPDVVSSLCRFAPCSRISVCPLVGPLAAFGLLAGSLMIQGLECPRVDLFYRPVSGSLNIESQEFDDRLDGDGLGRMAYLIRGNVAVLNRMMETPCLSPFYGMVLSCFKWWGEPVFLMTKDVAQLYFPKEPLSLRQFASSWVPVEVSNTKEFAVASGYGATKVRIVTSSEHIPGLSTFLRFAMALGRKFVAASHTKDVTVPVSMPLFCHNRAYNVDATLYAEMVEHGPFGTV